VALTTPASEPKTTMSASAGAVLPQLQEVKGVAQV
jgi:hypothetical protein